MNRVSVVLRWLLGGIVAGVLVWRIVVHLTPDPSEWMRVGAMIAFMWVAYGIGRIRPSVPGDSSLPLMVIYSGLVVLLLLHVP